ncbi:replication termination protein [Bacillaceae bacterium]
MDEKKQGRYQRRFLIKQTALLKLYLITMIENDRCYGRQFYEELTEKFKAYGFKPYPSQIYELLIDMYHDGWVKREEVKKDPDGLQKVVFYRFTDYGYEQARLFKKQVKADLDRSIGLLQKALKDNF